jgi:hypothetical protein
MGVVEESESTITVEIAGGNGNGSAEPEPEPAPGGLVTPIPESPGFGLESAPVRSKGKLGCSCGPGDAGGKSRSFHVPGMSATGRIHVAVNMIPHPESQLASG